MWYGHKQNKTGTPSGLSRLGLLTSLILNIIVAVILVSCGNSPAGKTSPSSDTRLGLIQIEFVGGEQANSLEEARSRVSFDIWVPQKLPEGYKLVWIGTSAPDSPVLNEFVRLVYSDGEHPIGIGQGPYDSSQYPPLTDEQLVQWGQQKVMIKGSVAMGHEGETVQTVHGRMQEPTALEWRAAGIRYAIWTIDFSLPELLAIGESMEPTQ